MTVKTNGLPFNFSGSELYRKITVSIFALVRTPGKAGGLGKP